MANFFELVTVSRNSFHIPEVTETKKMFFSKRNMDKSQPNLQPLVIMQFFSLIYRSFCNSVLLL